MLRTILFRDRRHPFLLLLSLFILLLSAHAAQAQPYLGTGAGNPGVSTGARNTALGDNALSSNTSGFDNTAVGFDACRSTTSGFLNTALGSFALDANTTGSLNTAIGNGALPSNTTGNTNTAVGVDALDRNTTASANTAVGYEALFGTTTGGNNTALGANSLANTGGTNNIGIGVFAGANITNGSYNIDIGNSAPGNESNTIRIGNITRQTAAFLAGVNGATISSGTQVFVDASGQLGTLTSSVRFKEDIEPMGEASHDLMKLRPVTFRYKAPYDDGSHTLQYGLIAEEVAKVYPELVQLDAKGQPLTVRYHSINVMLLNELQNQQAQLDQQAARIKRLEALLDRKADAAKAP
jgi:Chaperone of endosialidase